MNLWLRLLRVLVAAFWRRRDFLEDSVLRFRVMPHDLDINLHMNNARYLGLMDLGRADLLVRGGLWRTLVRERWQPVLGGSLVHYRRPLAPFQKFTLTSRAIAWDEKWMYIEHHVEADGVVACSAYVRGAFVSRRGVISPIRIARLLGIERPSPPLPAWHDAWSHTGTRHPSSPASPVVETGAV